MRPSPDSFAAQPLTGTESLVEWVRASPEARADRLRSCLARIAALDSTVQAWVQVLPQAASGAGGLSGVAFGAKDVIETRGLSTEYGSPIYKGRVGIEDAWIVRALRQRGAILLGKTQTAAFAHRAPAPTRNPWSPGHTPGGSSSGSAAAVAAGMAPLALGTQTLGSVLRPASYCGITGFKPTHGRLPMDGVLPLAPSLDTLGFFTATAEDMMAFWEAFGQDTGDHADVTFGVVEPLPDVEPPMAAALHAATARLREAGVALEPVALGDVLTKLVDAARIVMAYEAARVHDRRHREHGASLGELARLIEVGLAVPAARYDEARRSIATSGREMAARFARTPVMLAPAATGPAPPGLEFTGDPRMNAPWTALGTPAIAIQMAAYNGLPLGLQLFAERDAEARVLRAAVRLERILRGAPGPGRPAHPAGAAPGPRT